MSGVTIEIGGVVIETTTERMREVAVSLEAGAKLGGHNAHGKLKSLVERIERLEEDKAAVANDLKEVYGEAKGEGFDTRIIRKVVRLRKQDAAKRAEEAALIELYITAIGGL